MNQFFERIWNRKGFRVFFLLLFVIAGFVFWRYVYPPKPKIEYPTWDDNY